MQHYRDEILYKRYRLTHIIGQGGMASVYYATDIIKSINVAIKQNSHFSQEDRMLFDTEVKLLSEILAQPSSPKNIPIIFDYFTENSGGQILQYTVMQYIEGEDLDSIIQRGCKIEPIVAVFWLDQVMQSVEFFHNLQPSIVHRDIKPSNIRVDKTGEMAYLVDFGLAGGVSQKYGTPGFAPIEQYQGKSDHRSDIYALGATLYALLSCEDPPDALELKAKQKKLFGKNAAIDLKIKTCIEKAMQSEPSKRYRSVSELRLALRNALGLPTDGKIPIPKIQSISVQMPAQLADAPAIKLVPYQPWYAERNARCMRIVYSAGSRNLISGGTQNIRFWPIMQWNTPPINGFNVAGHSDWVSSLAISEKSDLMASASRDCMIHLVDVATRRMVRSWRSLHISDIPALSFSVDGQFLASSGRGDKKIVLWNLHRPDEPPLSIAENVIAYGLSFSMDGQWLGAACDDNCIRIWRATDFQEINLDKTLKKTKAWLAAVSFSPDGALMAAGGADGMVYIRRLRDTKNNALLEENKWSKVDVPGGHQGTIFDLAFSLDSRFLVTGGGDRVLKIWDTQYGKLISSFGPLNAEIISIVFASPTIILVALADGSIHPVYMC